MDYNRLCMGCMEEFEENEKICPHCGYHRGTPMDNINGLEPFTILNGQYLVGRSLGEGGFGITYLAYDLNNSCKVAIKEYFPSGLVSRDKSLVTGPTVKVEGQQTIDIYQKGLDRFTNEAMILKKYNTLPGIVSVKQLFQENGTAYMVMEYIEGVTLAKYLDDKTGKTSEQEVLSIMRPIIDALVLLHKDGIIHRDISPDNIMLTKSNTVKLIDFGAARYFQGESNKSLTIMLKRGYAPTEQYQTRGKQGAWTDVYALAGVIYRMITGIVPPESIARLTKSEVLKTPSELNSAMTSTVEQALLKGLAVVPEDRYQTVWDFKNALYESRQDVNIQPIQSQEETEIPTNHSNKKSNLKVLIVSAAAMAVLLIVFCIWAVTKPSNTLEDENDQEVAAAVDPTIEETPTPQDVLPTITDEVNTMDEIQGIASPESVEQAGQDGYVSNVKKDMWLDLSEMKNANYFGNAIGLVQMLATENNGNTYLVTRDQREIMVIDGNGRIINNYTMRTDNDYLIDSIFVLDDGRFLMDIDRNTLGNTIWLMDPQKEKEQDISQLLNMPESEFMEDYKIISVDGQYLYFKYEGFMKNNGADRGLYRVDFNFTSPEKITFPDSNNYPFYAVNDEYFYYTRNSIIRLNNHDNSMTILHQLEQEYASLYDYQFTKDFLYTIIPNSESDMWELWKIALDGSGSKKIYEKDLDFVFFTYGNQCYVTDGFVFPLKLTDALGNATKKDIIEIDADGIQGATLTLAECVDKCHGCWTIQNDYLWKRKTILNVDELSSKQN